MSNKAGGDNKGTGAGAGAAAGGGVAYTLKSAGGGAGEQTGRPQRAAAVASKYRTAQQLSYISATRDARGGVNFGYQPASYNAYNGAVQAQQQYHHSNGGFTSGEGYARYGWR